MVSGHVKLIQTVYGSKNILNMCYYMQPFMGLVAAIYHPPKHNRNFSSEFADFLSIL